MKLHAQTQRERERERELISVIMCSRRQVVLVVVASFLVGGVCNGMKAWGALHDGTWPHLQSSYYNQSCPQAEYIIFSIVQKAVQREARMAASLLRLHFHDCFVNGCDGSILLDSTPAFESEKEASPNKNSVRGYSVIDEIKASLETACPLVVSCADILALAARDSVLLSGGPYWQAELGRKDGMVANVSGAEVAMPSPSAPMEEITKKFEEKGLSVEDMVVLSGAHTIGQARCLAFRERLMDNRAHGQTGPQMQADMLNSLRALCRSGAGNESDTLAALDVSTPLTFDSGFFKNLARGEGLLQSDQLLYTTPGITRNLAAYYLTHQQAFLEKFALAMIKLGRIGSIPGASTSSFNDDKEFITFSSGEIRRNCRHVNN